MNQTVGNDGRATRLNGVLNTYAEADSHSNLLALLSDARHWCDRYALSYADLDSEAYGQYLFQLVEERETPL